MLRLPGSIFCAGIIAIGISASLSCSANKPAKSKVSFDRQIIITSLGAKPSEPNTVKQKSIATNPDLAPRWHKVTCNWVCDQWETERDIDFGVQQRTCLKWAENCGASAQQAGFYQSHADMDFDILFRSKSYGTYQGCGPSAAMNVLQFFGDNTLDEAEIRAMMSSYEIGDQIASTPKELTTKLEQLLHRYTHGRYSLQRRRNATTATIRSELSKGNLVIALINNGTHYVVVTGFNSLNDIYNYHVIDYARNDRWLSESQIDLGFSSNQVLLSVGEEIVINGEWHPDTIIIIEKTSAAECKSGESRTLACPVGKRGPGKMEVCRNSRWSPASDECVEPDQEIK